MRVALERIAIPTASGTDCDKAVTGRDATVGYLGRQRCFLAICGLQNELAGKAGASAIVPPGTVGQAIAFDRGAPVTQVANRLNRGEATSPLAGSAGILPQFVALHTQGNMGLDILDRIITRISVEGVHGVHTVTTIAPAVTPFEDFEMDPRAVAAEAAGRNHLEIANPRTHLLRQRLGKRPHDRITQNIPGNKARDGWRRKDGIGQGSFWRDNRDRPVQPTVLRNIPIRLRIQQDRPQHEPHGHIDGAHERHIDRSIGYLRSRTGEIHDQVTSFDRQGDDDRQIPPARAGIV